MVYLSENLMQKGLGFMIFKKKLMIDNSPF